MDETLRTWGTLIKTRREARGLTRKQLADTLDVKVPTVWRWENGLMEPRRDHKQQLAVALATTVRTLFPHGSK